MARRPAWARLHRARAAGYGSKAHDDGHRAGHPYLRTDHLHLQHPRLQARCQVRVEREFRLDRVATIDPDEIGDIDFEIFGNLDQWRAPWNTHAFNRGGQRETVHRKPAQLPATPRRCPHFLAPKDRWHRQSDASGTFASPTTIARVSARHRLRAESNAAQPRLWFQPSRPRPSARLRRHPRRRVVTRRALPWSRRPGGWQVPWCSCCV